MAANSTLVLVIQAETGQANSAIKGTGNTFLAFESQAIKSMASASRGVEGFEKSAIRAAVNVQNKFSAFGGVLGANVVSGLTQRAGELSVAGFKIAASFERSRIGLEAFLGSAEKAEKLFGEIQDFALKSPFEFKDLLVGANRLLAFDFAAKDIITTLRGISSSVGALGGDIGNVNNLIAALGQIRQAGKLTGEELRQLRNAGVEGTAIKALGEAYGLTAAQVNKAVRDGIIPGVDAVTIIVKALDEKYNPLLEKVSKTTEVSLSNVKDSFGKASEQAFKPFLADINKLAQEAGPELEKFGLSVRDNAGNIRALAEGVVVLGAVLVAAKIPAGFAAISLALQGMTAAALANPWGLMIAGAVGLGYVLYKGEQSFTQYADSVEKDFVQKLHKQGKSVGEIVEEIKKYNAEITLLNNAGSDQGFRQPRFNANAENVKMLVGDLPENILIKKMEELQKKGQLFSEQQKKDFQRRMEEQRKLAGEETARKAVTDAEGQARKILNDALKGQLTSLDKIGFELAENLILYGKSKQAIEDLGKASKVSFETELRRATGKRFEEAQDAERKRIDDLQKTRLQAEAETLQQSLELRKQTIERGNEFEFRELERSRDRELEQLGQIDDSTTQGKLLIEQKKLDIESAYIEQAAVLRISGIDRETQLQIEKYQSFVNSKLITEEAFVQVRDALLRDSGERARDVEADFIAQIELLRLQSANKSAQVQRDLMRDTFNDIKRSAGSVFDQFVRDAKGVFGTLGALFKTALLTPLKEVFTNEVARFLTPVLSQIRGTGSGGSNSGSVAGGLFSLFGQRGAFGMPGAPGGTGGFAGPVSAVNLGLGRYGGLPSIIGANGQIVATGQEGPPTGMGPLGSILAMPGGKALLTQLGQLGATSKMFSKGIYGAKGGALLAGGGILAFDGLRRGGLLGTLETAAGGAMIGAKFGGVYGAAIGASVGLAAGLIRNLFKSANEKAREKIKAIYGVDISSKDILGQVVSIAKQSFGGDLEVAIRSKDVQDLVELYALSTGQSARGLAAKMQPVTLSTSGGVTGILANYSNGKPVTVGGAQTAGPTVFQFALDGASSAAFLQGQTVNAIESNPRSVAAATNAAQQSNFNRQQSAVNQLQPGLLLA